MKTLAVAMMVACMGLATAVAVNRPAASDAGSGGDTTCVLTVYVVPLQALPDEICRAVYEIAEGMDFTIVAGDLNHRGTNVWIKVCGPESKIAEFVHELYD